MSDVKHVHYDNIVKWASDPSQKVWWRWSAQPSGWSEWKEKVHSPSWHEDLEYHIGDVAPRYDAPKTGSDLTRQMFNESSKPILCYVSNMGDDEAIQKNYPVLVIGIAAGGHFIGHSKSAWNYAVPYEHAVRTLEDVTL